jgi:hypothetical protein
VAEHGALQIINHDPGGDPAESGESVLMAGKEVFHGLGYGEFHVHLATVAEHHDEEAEATHGFTDPWF